MVRPCMRFSKFRTAAVSLALAAMMLRALLPAGWMPGAIASGTPLVLCTMGSMAHAAPAKNGGPLERKPTHDDGRHHEVCPFSAAPHLAPPAAAAAILPSYAVTGGAARLAQSPLRQVSRYVPQAPRAPPVSL